MQYILKEYKRGSCIFSTGDTPLYLYLIKSGAVKILHRAYGQSTIVHIAKSNEIFGEMSIITDTLHTNDAIAETETVCWLIPRCVLNERLSGTPAIVNALLKRLITQVRKSNDWLSTEKFLSNTIPDDGNWPLLLQNLQRLRSVGLHEHELRVGLVVSFLCSELNMSDEETQAIKVGAQLHDIGMSVVSDSALGDVLNPGEIDNEQFTNHCENGAALLGILQGQTAATARDIARYHHENHDGSGFPYGLKGADIPWSARIVSVADCFDKLVASGTDGYQKRFSRALETMTGSTGPICARKFDTMILEALSRISAPLTRIYNVPWETVLFSPHAASANEPT